MKIGGFQPFTLTDFPQRVAAIVFTQGCNFKCPFCHNVELISGKPSSDSIPDEQEVLSRLEQRTGKLDGVVVTGGEPTIQKDLVQFCSKLKSMGYSVKVDTNGSAPHMLEELIESGVVDFLAMDIKAPLNIYQRLAGVPVNTDMITRSIKTIASSGVEHMFRTTFARPLLGERHVEAILDLVPPGSTHVFQEFRPEKVLCPEAFSRQQGQASSCQ